MPPRLRAFGRSRAIQEARTREARADLRRNLTAQQEGRCADLLARTVPASDPPAPPTCAPCADGDCQSCRAAGYRPFLDRPDLCACLARGHRPSTHAKET